MAATEAQIDMHSFHSDFYKEVYGIRPRWLSPEDCTVEEWQSMIDRLIVEAREEEEEAQEEARALAAIASTGGPLRVSLAEFMDR